VRRLPLAGAAVGLVLLASFAVLQAAQPRPAPTVAARASQLAAELRCPDCQALSVAESRTAAAAAIRREIDAQLAAGRSVDEVRSQFVARYGQWILLQPADPLIWVLPVVVLLTGIGIFTLWLRRAPTPRSDVPSGMNDPDRRRVRDEVEALDG
jgi:cytochrome c-type biogenesis protein CcmH